MILAIYAGIRHEAMEKVRRSTYLCRSGQIMAKVPFAIILNNLPTLLSRHISCNLRRRLLLKQVWVGLICDERGEKMSDMRIGWVRRHGGRTLPEMRRAAGISAGAGRAGSGRTAALGGL